MSAQDVTSETCSPTSSRQTSFAEDEEPGFHDQGADDFSGENHAAETQRFRDTLPRTTDLDASSRQLGNEPPALEMNVARSFSDTTGSQLGDEASLVGERIDPGASNSDAASQGRDG